MPRLKVRNLTRGVLLADRAGIADTSATRRTGLLKHDRLEPGDGLWITPCEAVHMFGMKFAIDVLFLGKKDAEGRRQVVKAVPNLGRWRISLSLTAKSALELPAGTIDATGTQKGDVLEFERYG